MRIERIGALILSALLVACGCTAVGCNNQVRFHSGTDLQPGVPYEVAVCFDDRCEEASLTASELSAGLVGGLGLWADLDTVEFSLGDGDFGGSHHVTYSLHDADGQTIAAFDDTIELTRSEPNGGWPCGPTCWSADLEL